MLSYDDIESLAKRASSLPASHGDWRMAGWRDVVLELIAHARGQDAEIRRLQRVEEKARALNRVFSGNQIRGYSHGRDTCGTLQIVAPDLCAARDALAAALEDSK